MAIDSRLSIHILYRVSDRIEVSPDVCSGKAVIRGTRIAVSTILGYLTAGDSIDDVIAAHPGLTREDVLACLAYAQNITDRHTLLPVGA